MQRDDSIICSFTRGIHAHLGCRGLVENKIHIEKGLFELRGDSWSSVERQTGMATNSDDIPVVVIVYQQPFAVDCAISVREWQQHSRCALWGAECPECNILGTMANKIDSTGQQNYRETESTIIKTVSELFAADATSVEQYRIRRPRWRRRGGNARTTVGDGPFGAIRHRSVRDDDVFETRYHIPPH